MIKRARKILKQFISPPCYVTPRVVTIADTIDDELKNSNFPDVRTRNDVWLRMWMEKHYELGILK